MASFDDYSAVVLRVRPPVDAAVREGRTRPGLAEDGTPVDADGVRLLTADEIADQLGVPLSDVALWVAAGRLSSVFLPGDHRRHRETQVVSLLERLAVEREQAARRYAELIGLTNTERELLFDVAAGRVRHEHGRDILLRDNGSVRAYLFDRVGQLPPGLVKLPPSRSVYRLTVHGEACLPAVTGHG